MKTSHQNAAESLNASTANTKAFFGAQQENAFFQPTIQAKLTIGQTGDQFEQEADSMAGYVINRLASTDTAPGVQSKCAACAEEEAQMKPEVQKMDNEEEELSMKPEIQKMDNEEEELSMKPEVQKMDKEEEELSMKPEIQRMRSESPAEAGPDFEEKLSATQGGGQSLPSETLGEMNEAFGADFSQVRVHNDSTAVQMSKDIGAQAFTHSNNIYFNQGKYSPDSSEGKTLLAHELTHTIQQGAVKEETE